MNTILQVISDTNIGGGGRSLLNYLSCQDRSQFQSQVVLPRGSALKGPVEALGVPVHEIDAMADRSMDLSAVAPLRRVIRAVDPDLFSAVVHHIVGQQVSMRAQATVGERLRAALGEVSAQTVAALDAEALRGMGMSLRKAKYILGFARRVQSDEFDLEGVRRMDDGQAIAAFTSLRGVGVWTAEMILLFCLQRPDVLSYDDLAIRRGLRMLYRHKALDRKRA